MKSPEKPGPNTPGAKWGGGDEPYWRVNMAACSKGRSAPPVSPDTASAGGKSLLDSLKRALKSAAHWRHRAEHWKALYCEWENAHQIRDESSQAHKEEVAHLCAEIEKRKEDEKALAARVDELQAENEKLKKLVAELSNQKHAPSPVAALPIAPYTVQSGQPFAGKSFYTYDAFGHLIEHPAKGAD